MEKEHDMGVVTQCQATVDLLATVRRRITTLWTALTVSD